MGNAEDGLAEGKGGRAMTSEFRKREVSKLEARGGGRPNGRLSAGAGTRRPVRFEPALSCPGNATLVAYLKATNLAPQALEAVRLHLVGCSACRARVVSARDSINLGPREVRRSRMALGFIAGMAAAVGLWFGWIYYTESRVARLEALVNHLDIELKVQKLLAEAPTAMIRLSKGPDRSPAVGPLRLPWINRGKNNWKARVLALVRSYPGLIQEDLQPESAFWNLGVLLLLAGEPKAAVTALGATGSPSDPAFLNDLGAARLAAGQLAQAQVNLQEALRLRPLFPQAAFNLALALDAAGHLQPAAAQWLEYLALDSQTAWAIHARRRLATLEARG